MAAQNRPVVLVVEDDPLVQIHSLLALEDAGYDVVEARDAADALGLLADRPDVGALFTDVHIAGDVDGLALAAAVHRRRPDIAIVVTSGVESIAADRMPACARFVAKPYTAAQLTRLMTAA